MEILFENEKIVVVNKPAGMLIHNDGSGRQETVVNWIKEKYPDIKDVGEDVRIRTGEIVKKPGIVHRLDKDTTGVLIIVKDQETFLHIKGQFKVHSVEKVYHAFVYGNVKESEGEIDRPIGKSRSDFRKYSAQRGARGVLREAQTFFKVLGKTEKGDATFLELKPKTGRTHQIRVHLKAVHHPVVADHLYAPKGEKILGFDRLALHARSISFRLTDGQQVSVEAPYPEDFERALVEIKTLW